MRKLFLLLLASASVVGCGDDSASGGGGAGASSAGGGSPAEGGSAMGGSAMGGSAMGGNAMGGAPPTPPIIPEDRLMDWSKAGVPGGIPTIDTICATVTDLTQLQAAVDACEGGVIYIPEGTYTFNESIVNASHNGVVIRGAGPGKTILNAEDGGYFSFGNPDFPVPIPDISVTAGATRNSTTITLASADGFTPGGLMKIGVGVNPPFVHDLGMAAEDRMMEMAFRVVSVNGSYVTFEPALPFDFSPYEPMAAPFVNLPLTGVGFEDFTIDVQGNGDTALQLYQMWGSWISNVELAHAGGRLIDLDTVLNSEIRHCNFHDSLYPDPNRIGLVFYRDVDWNLIEDNILYDVAGVVVGANAGNDTGNVFAYNFVFASNSGVAGVAGRDIDLNHGSNNTFNLLEGNIAGGVVTDDNLGSTSHDTLYRNWLTASHPTATNGLAAVKLRHFSDYFNVVGNVLGTNAFPTTGNVDGSGHAFGGFYDAPEMTGYDDGGTTGVQVIYELGFPNWDSTDFDGTLAASDPIDYSSEGDTLATAQSLDRNVLATMIRHGNYDWFNGEIVWDPDIVEHELAASLFRSVEPAFFGSLAWPPFDPSAPADALDDENLARIPAGYRYLHGVDP